VEFHFKVCSLGKLSSIPLVVACLLALANVGLVAAPNVDDKKALGKISDDALTLSWQKLGDMKDLVAKDVTLRNWRSDGYIISIDDQKTSRLPMDQWNTETHRAYYVKEPTFSFGDLVPGKTYAVKIAQVGDFTQKSGRASVGGINLRSIHKNPLEISVPPTFHKRGTPIKDSSIKVALKELYDHPDDYLGKVLRVEGYTSPQKESNPTPITVPNSVSPNALIWETLTMPNGQTVRVSHFAWQPAPASFSLVVSSPRTKNDGSIYDGNYQLGVSGGSIWLVEPQSKGAFNYLELLGYLVKGSANGSGARSEYFFENLAILKYTKK